MGYLDEYGEQEARRAQRLRQTKRAIVGVSAVLVAAGVFYFWFKNYPEEKLVKGFLAAVERGDYPAAYGFWGCRAESPCPNYSYKDFLEDWGPNPPSQVGKVQSFRLGMSRERGSGVVVPVILNDRIEKKLWVEKRTGVLGFSPPI